MKTKTQEHIHLEDCTELGINRGVAYRRLTNTWYPIWRVGAVYGWDLYKTPNHLWVSFETREAAINYLKGR